MSRQFKKNKKHKKTLPVWYWLLMIPLMGVTLYTGNYGAFTGQAMGVVMLAAIVRMQNQ